MRGWRLESGTAARIPSSPRTPPPALGPAIGNRAFVRLLQREPVCSWKNMRSPECVRWWQRRQAEREARRKHWQDLRPAADAYSGIDPYYLATEHLRRDVGVVPEYMWRFSDWLMVPHLVMAEGDHPLVAYYLAFNQDAQRNEFIIGPDALEYFLSHEDLAKRIRNSAYGFVPPAGVGWGNGQPSADQVAMAKTGLALTQGAGWEALRHWRKAWVEQAKNPMTWANVLVAYAAAAPRAGEVGAPLAGEAGVPEGGVPAPLPEPVAAPGRVGLGEFKAQVAKTLEHFSDQPVNEEWTALEPLLKDPAIKAANPDLLENLARVHLALRDPDLIERVMVEVWERAAADGITPEEALVRMAGRGGKLPVIKSRVLTAEQFRPLLRQRAPFIDNAFQGDIHGVYSHAFQELVVAKELGSLDAAANFRRLIYSATNPGEAADAAKPFFSQVWDALYDSTNQATLNSPEMLGQILHKHLGLPGAIRAQEPSVNR